jgi:hypothetical protein
LIDVTTSIAICVVFAVTTFVYGWLFGNRVGYYRGRLDGWDRCDAAWLASLEEMRARADAVDSAWLTAERRASTLGRVVQGSVVNEGDRMESTP